MSFIISAKNSAGGIALKEDIAKAAVIKALELMGQGYENVYILAPNGMIFKSEEFHLLIGRSGE